jgi:hydrogenase nickel incorporation protein HypA/HybF
VVHEWDLVEQAVKTLNTLAEGKPVREVEIALGPGADRVRAIEAWRALTATTSLAGAHVTWEEAADLFRCEQCSLEYTAETGGACPYCGGDGVVVEPASPI